MGQKIIIVGAGPGGLATALRLAGQGYDVEVFEAQSRVGGRMRGFEKEATPLILAQASCKCRSSTMISLPVQDSIAKPISPLPNSTPILASNSGMRLNSI